MTARAVALGGPSKVAVDEALREIRLALQEHFWVYNASAKLEGGDPVTEPTTDELNALLDLYVRPALQRLYLEPLFGDERDRYILDDKIFEVALTIGTTCEKAGFVQLDNTRQLVGLRHALERILAP